MATITHAGTTYNTTAGNKTVVATPAVGDLIVVIAPATGVVTSAVSDNQGGTYTQVDSDRTGWSTTGHLSVWIRDALIPAASSTTFTATQASSTGGGLSVLRVSGMTRTGALALRSNGGQSAGTSGTTPAPVMNQAALTGNPVIFAVASGTNSTTTLTQPSGFTEAFDNGYATPTTGLEVAFVNSGVTSATITAGSTVASAFGSVAIELDTSAVPGPTITAFETADWTGTGTPKTISVPGALTGDLIVVLYGGDNFGSTVTAATVSTTGGSTDAWQELDEDLGASSNMAWQSAAYATVTADGTVTVSLARTQGGAQVWGGYALLAHNHGGIGNHAHLSNGATETVSLTTSQDSTVAGLGIDWDDLSLVASLPAGYTTVERTAGTAVAWYATYWLAQAAGTRSYGIATSSTANFKLTVIEIKASGGAVTGVLAASFSLAATVAGLRTVKAVTAAASSLTGTVVGKRTVKGTAAASSTLAAAVSAKRKVLGAAAGTSGLTAVVSGASVRTGTASASSGLAAVAVATRSVAATVAGSLSLSAVVGGVRTVLGTAVAGSTLTGSGSGQHGVSGTASAVSALVASVTGVRTVRGSSASGSVLTATISGVVVSPGTGAALAGSSLTATATGVRTVVGAAGAGSALTGSATGTVDSGGATVTGAASAALSLAGQAVGVRTVTGSAAGAFGASATLLGQRTVTGVLIADLIFLAVAFSPPPTVDGDTFWLTLEDLMGARDDQNSIMFDRVRLYHDEHTDGSFDPDLGYETTEMPEPYYDGPARVQARPVQSGSRITGEQAVTALGYAVAIPWDVTDARPSDIVEVYQAEYEPAHVGKRLRILDVQSSTYVTARRMSCVGYQERSPV